jgi:hypothetical protein
MGAGQHDTVARTDSCSVRTFSAGEGRPIHTNYAYRTLAQQQTQVTLSKDCPGTCSPGSYSSSDLKRRSNSHQRR